jgi:hypothetical protein
MSETETPTGRPGRVVKDEAILDLSHFTEPAQLAAISRIEDVAVVVVPESLAAAYAAIPTTDVASTLYVPSGVNVRLQTGSLTVGGDGLGAENDVLVVIGLLLITSPVTGPVPKRIYVVGSVLAPRGSEQLLGPALAGGTGAVSYYDYSGDQHVKVLSGQVRLSPAVLANAAGRPDDILVVAGEVVVTGEVLEPAIEMQGQVTWYEGANPRVFNGSVSIGPDFLRLLPAPTSLVVLGDLMFEEAVTEAAVQEKVAGLAVFGDVIAPAGLIGVVQFVATDVFGDIMTSDQARERAGNGPDGSGS